MTRVISSTHPLVAAKLVGLRAPGTKPAEFRALVRALSTLLAAEATADLPTRPVAVPTPLGTAQARELVDVLGVVPILRAGLGMAEGVLDLVPEAEVRHLGLYRDEATLLPHEYYHRPPQHCRITLALIVDPMLATGGSVAHACEVVHGWGVRRIKVISLIAAPEGIARLSADWPDVPIHVGVVDERLSDVGFILPGLGDAGDRQFGTGDEHS